MNILLTGGTGFIGSHTAVELITRGHKAVLYDNLCNSDAAVVDALEKITGKRPLLVVGDIRDTEKLQAVLIAEKIDVVIHFAGLKPWVRAASSPWSTTTTTSGARCRF